MSMELISREEALDCSIYAHDWNSYSDLIAELPTVKAIPIERLEQIRAEINEQKKCVELDVDDDLFCLFWYIVGLNNAIEIIDKYRKER